jgi:hypothetical protein
MEIKFETEEFVFFKAGRNFTGFCGQCNALVEMLTMETAAVFSGFSELEIFRLMEAGEIHFIETERVFVCQNSLPISKE